MTCSGHAYCFPGMVDPLGVDPTCSKKGFKYYPNLKKCAKVVGRQCDPDHDGVPAPTDSTLCLKCGLGYYINTNGLCEPQCKIGYLQVVVNGIKYCVQQCKDDATPQGNVCVEFEEQHGEKSSGDAAGSGYGAATDSYGAATDSYGAKAGHGKHDKPPKCPKTCEQKSCPHGSYLFWENPVLNSKALLYQPGGGDTYSRDTYNAIMKAAVAKGPTPTYQDAYSTGYYSDYVPVTPINATYGSKLAVVKADYCKCRCAEVKTRKVYEKGPPVKPKISKAPLQYAFCDAVCLDKGKINHEGKCKSAKCPPGSKPAHGGTCVMVVCPDGYKACSGPKGELFCATKADLFGCDSCNVVGKYLWDEVDPSATCSYKAPPVPAPSPRPASPRPPVVVLPAPVASPKPAAPKASPAKSPLVVKAAPVAPKSG